MAAQSNYHPERVRRGADGAFCATSDVKASSSGEISMLLFRKADSSLEAGAMLCWP
jgi:hypothetical protein